MRTKMLLLYDITPKVDPHGARVRLVRRLKKSGAVPLQRSTWLVHEITPELLEIIDEIRALGGTFLLTEWKPIQFSRLRDEFKKLNSSNVVGLVVHGPEIINLGSTEKIFNFLEGTGANIKARIGGTRGRTAVIDANLDDVIDVEDPKQPSRVVDGFAKENVDLIILSNHGKSLESGISMGAEVFEKAKLPRMLGVPFIQIERLGESDGVVIPWTKNIEDLARWLAPKLNLKMIKPPTLTERIEVEEGKTRRRILGVSPGDEIFIDDFVIGKSDASDVTLVAESGEITDLIGGRLDQQGVEKIGKIDLANTMVKALEA